MQWVQLSDRQWHLCRVLWCCLLYLLHVYILCVFYVAPTAPHSYVLCKWKKLDVFEDTCIGLLMPEEEGTIICRNVRNCRWAWVNIHKIWICTTLLLCILYLWRDKRGRSVTVRLVICIQKAETVPCRPTPVAKDVRSFLTGVCVLMMLAWIMKRFWYAQVAIWLTPSWDLLCNLKNHYGVHTNAEMGCILSQMNPICTYLTHIPIHL